MKAFVNKTEGKLDAMPDRQWTARIDDERGGRPFVICVERQLQPIAVQVHVFGERLQRLADSRLLADQERQHANV